MSNIVEQSGGGAYDDSEPNPTFEERVRELDAADQRLMMAYSVYLDKPKANRMTGINRSRVEMFDEFGLLLQFVVNVQGTEDDKIMLFKEIAGLLHGYGIEHSKLLAEYIPDLKLPTEKEGHNALVASQECLSGNGEESLAGFVDEALEHLGFLLNGDMDVIEQEIIRRVNSPKSIAIETLRTTGLEVAKVGAGVLAGLFIFEKIRTKK